METTTLTTTPTDDAEFGLTLAASLSLPTLRPAAPELLSDQNRRVAVIHSSGWMSYISRRFAQDLLDRDTGPIRNRFVQALHEQALADERMAIVREVIASGRPRIAFQLLRGRRYRLAFLPMADQTGQASVILVACQTLCGDALVHVQGAPESITCSAATLGPIGMLTVRELDVLRSLGLGIRRSSIAERLRCTARDLQGIIKRLRLKLKAKDTFALSIIGIRLGLIDFDDDQWGSLLFLRE